MPPFLKNTSKLEQMYLEAMSWVIETLLNKSCILRFIHIHSLENAWPAKRLYIHTYILHPWILICLHILQHVAYIYTCTVFVKVVGKVVPTKCNFQALCWNGTELNNSQEFLSTHQNKPQQAWVVWERLPQEKYHGRMVKYSQNHGYCIFSIQFKIWSELTS